MKRRIEIAQETNQLIVLRRQGNAIQSGWCDRCAEQVQMVTSEQGALIAGMSLRQIVRETDAGKLHFQETPDGRLLICLNSLNPVSTPEKEQYQIAKDLTKGY